MSGVRLVWARGPSGGPTACAIASRRCALWGWRGGIPGGGAFRRCGGRLSSGAPPPPAARSLGGLSGSATRVPWARVCGRGGPALSPWFVCHVGGAGRLRAGGGGLLPRRGASGVWRCPSPGRLPSGAGSRGSATRVYGRGDPAPFPQRAPLRAVAARCGGGGRAPLGGCRSPL